MRLWATWSHPYLIILYYGLILPIVIYYFFRRRKKSLNIRRLSKMLEEILSIRNILINNYLYKEIIHTTWQKERKDVFKLGIIE